VTESLLLQFRLTPPRASRKWIRRSRLVELLGGALDARLTLVSAPAGFGKTTALVDWLAESGVPAAWIPLVEADNDPARFLRYLWAGAAMLDGRGAGATGEGTPGTNADDVIDEVALLLAEQPEPRVLVLDDYHVMTAPDVRHTVAALLERLPAQAHLVISTRQDPSLPLARLRAHGELLELRADALRFTDQEAKVFLSDRMGVQLSDDELATLMARTEGWPAVLQLAGLSLAGQTDVSRRVRDFAASHRYVLDYITDEVLSRLDAADSEFLVQTSVLDRLTGPLCDAVTGRTDGRATLERLEQANVLLVPLDDDRCWYRYHHLFAELLRSRLAVADPAKPAALHLRAADWCAEHGFAADAIEHALSSGDVDRARGQIAAGGGALIHAGQLQTLLSLMDRLPQSAVRSHFRLSTFYALSLVLSGQTEGVDRHLADAEAALPAALASGLPGAAVQASYHALIRSIAARLRHDPVVAVGHAEQALALAPPGAAGLLADIHSTLGLALLDAGEVDRAIDELRAARPAVRAAGNWIALADATRDLARLEARRGRLRTAIEACEEVLSDFVDPDGHEMPAAARIHLARAEILARWGDPGAVAAAERAIELARRGGDVTSLRDSRALRERAAGMSARSLPSRALAEPLTARELEVLRLVAAGRSNRQIAAQLFVTVGTVKTHVHTVSGKLGAANRVEAVARGRELGLLA
jgi:LuxR family transcriptional regulator, maltose regulon positive regulatory protein